MPQPETPETENAATLTAEQRAQMETWIAAHPFGDQDENGVDLSLLRENLKRSPLARLQRLQSAIDSLSRLKDARR